MRRMPIKWCSCVSVDACREAKAHRGLGRARVQFVLWEVAGNSRGGPSSTVRLASWQSTQCAPRKVCCATEDQL